MRTDIKEALEVVIERSKEQIQREYTIADYLLNNLENEVVLWYLSEDEQRLFNSSVQKKQELRQSVENFIKENYSCNLQRRKQLRKEERNPNFEDRMGELISEMDGYIRYTAIGNGCKFEVRVNCEVYRIEILADDFASMWVTDSKNKGCLFRDLDPRLMTAITQEIWFNYDPYRP